jgi:hypothetical protein
MIGCDSTLHFVVGVDHQEACLQLSLCVPLFAIWNPSLLPRTALCVHRLTDNVSMAIDVHHDRCVICLFVHQVAAAHTQLQTVLQSAVAAAASAHASLPRAPCYTAHTCDMQHPSVTVTASGSTSAVCRSSKVIWTCTQTSSMSDAKTADSDQQQYLQVSI